MDKDHSSILLGVFFTTLACIALILFFFLFSAGLEQAFKGTAAPPSPMLPTARSVCIAGCDALSVHGWGVRSQQDYTACVLRVCAGLPAAGTEVAP